MGTRSITRIPGVAVMYRQFDGYPSGHGNELYEFLKDLVLVNGLSHLDSRRVTNGPNCLAAMMVSHFKTEAGGIYLYADSETDLGQDYAYVIDVVEAGILGTGDLVVSIFGHGGQIFKGSVAEFGVFCSKPEVDDE